MCTACVSDYPTTQAVDELCSALATRLGIEVTRIGHSESGVNVSINFRDVWRMLSLILASAVEVPASDGPPWLRAAPAGGGHAALAEGVVADPSSGTAGRFCSVSWTFEPVTEKGILHVGRTHRAHCGGR